MNLADWFIFRLVGINLTVPSEHAAVANVTMQI
jgi:hypothetical protein